MEGVETVSERERERDTERERQRERETERQRQRDGDRIMQNIFVSLSPYTDIQTDR